MFAECAGKCYRCYWGDSGCLAGHGDNDFTPATVQQLLERLVKRKYKDEHNRIREELVKRNPKRFAELTNGCNKLPEDYAREMLEFSSHPMVAWKE